jgi:hypothetical protein
MMGCMIVYTIPVELIVVFQCKPVEGLWSFLFDAKCINTVDGIYEMAILNILADALLIAFVIPRVGKTQLAEPNFPLPSR